MNFYEGKMVYVVGENGLAVNKEADNPKKEWSTKMMELNKEFGAKCGLEGSFSIYFCGGKEGRIDVLVACALDKFPWNAGIKWLRGHFTEQYDVEGVQIVDEKEISAERFMQLGERADNAGYIRNWRCENEELEINYFNNRQYKFSESMISEKSLSKKNAVSGAEKIMGDATLLEELERIYSKENERKYYGNPVHYKISGSNSEASMEIVHLMVSALYTNKRLLSRRIGHIFNICEGCYQEEDIEHILKSAQGGTVVIELSGTETDHGNYASAYEEVVDFFSYVINKYHLNTLCFFLENVEKPGFSKSLFAALEDDIALIEIKEGYGNKERALSYLKGLMEKTEYKVSQEEMENVLGDKNLFSIGEVYGIYQQWFISGLKERIYKAYKDCNTYRVERDKEDSEPYKELEAMIGLTEVKRLVGEIIDASKVRKMRSRMGLKMSKSSNHMLFTGNPGSAKTTVARLLAEILRKEGVLETGAFIECGRADLVGKYVGWTAPTIKTKFKRAKGGILFIDEAYSLVSDDGFGDEAITTIVQEMENHRDDVIVIFAGYPEKMKKFLEQNEGLRSRIAFHIDFPDYNPDEMTDILKLMIKKNGYVTDEETLKKCHRIFEGACTQAEFGNGRFARNLLEQAELAQSKRIISENKGKSVSKKKLQTLVADDFDVNASKNIRDTKRIFGFVG